MKRTRESQGYSKCDNISVDSFYKYSSLIVGIFIKSAFDILYTIREWKRMEKYLCSKVSRDVYQGRKMITSLNLLTEIDTRLYHNIDLCT